MSHSLHHKKKPFLSKRKNQATKMVSSISIKDNTETKKPLNSRAPCSRGPRAKVAPLLVTLALFIIVPFQPPFRVVSFLKRIEEEDSSISVPQQKIAKLQFVHIPKTGGSSIEQAAITANIVSVLDEAILVNIIMVTMFTHFLSMQITSIHHQ